jgi:branched-chain amino acid transport system ATP-binding protein
MLEIEQMNTFYGQSHILFDVGLTVGANEVVSLLGRNGAGKTTTLRSVMGLTPAQSGRIVFGGTDISRFPAHQVCRRGIGFVPEDRRIFPKLTVQENLEVAAQATRRKGSWSVERAYELFPQLAERCDNLGNQLSGGEQQMLTIARALMSNPDLILLDEPSEGLAPAIVRTVGDVVGVIRNEGISVLLVEQNAAFACRISDRVYILDDGRVRFHGSVAELNADEELKQRYLAL